MNIQSADLTFGVYRNATASITIPANVFMAIQLPLNVDHIRISNAVYLRDLLFQPRDEGTLQVGSLIISTFISSNNSFEGLDPPVFLTFTKNPVRNSVTSLLFIIIGNIVYSHNWLI